ncbi:MAG: T9SS C-terminal target domain-containing protein, partial [Sphingobacteriales bacterium]
LSTPGTAPKIETPSLSENSSSIKIFPNPVQGNEMMILTATTENANCALSIYSLSGRQLQTINYVSGNSIHQQSFDVSFMSSGIYLVRFQNGKDCITEKFVKQ